MELKLIDYNTALLAKEKGFFIKTNASYFINTKKLLKDMCCKNDVDGDDQFVSAPTQYLLQQWLREKHNIDIVVYPIEESINGKDIEQDVIEYAYKIYKKGLFVPSNLTYPYSYEEALEKALFCGLTLINI